MNLPYSELVLGAELMHSGVSTYLEQLAKLGFDEQYLAGLETDIKELIQLNNEQKQLQGQCKQKTAELATKKKEVIANLQRSKKLVKIEMPRQTWRQFGIPDKR